MDGSYGTSQETRGRSRSRSSSGRSRALRRRASSSLSSSRSRSAVGRRSRAALGNRTLVVSRNLNTNSFLPNRIECVMCTVLDAYWAAGTMTAAAGNYFNLFPNARTPMSGNTYTVTAGVGTATYASNALLLQGSQLANTPIGWSAYSGLYANYRVKRYRLEITVIPQNAQDATRLIVFPLGDEAIPSATAGNVNTRVLEAQPGAKAMTVAAGVSGTRSTNSMVIYGDVAKDLGKTTVDYMGLADTAVGSAPAAGTSDYIGVYLQQLNGANNTAVVSIQLRISQDIVFYDLSQEFN